MDCTILGDSLDIAGLLPRSAVDLLVLDPPYNLTKRFGENTFSRRPVDEYTDWLGVVLDRLSPLDEANRHRLHLWRLAYFRLDFHRRRNALASAQSDYMGA